MKIIKVYCGESVQDKCREQRHPVAEVKAAEELVKSTKDVIVYSNDPDFVRAIKYIGLKEGVQAEFFLNGVSHGNDIEPIFEDFNRALDLINELGKTED